MIGTWLVQRVALGLAIITAASVGFERLNPSLGVTADLRLTNLRLVLILTLGAWLLTCALRRRWPRVPRQVGVPVALWLGLLLLSAVVAPSYQMQALAFVRDVGLGIAFGWAVYDMAYSPSRQLILARALVLSGLGVAACGVAEALSVGPVVDWLAGFRYQTSFNVGEVPRISSTLTHPNITAMLLGLVLPLQLAWALTARTRLARLALGAGVGLELVALVLTVSRAGMLVAELVCGLVIWIGLRQHQFRLARLTAAAGLGLALLLSVAVLRQPILALHLTGENVQNWYRADYSTPAWVSAHAGEAVSVPIRLENTGERIWSVAGAHPFALSYHLMREDGTPVTYDGPRTSLPVDVAPGGSLDLQAQLIAPPTPGTYLVEWDGVQEWVTWFSWAGTPVGQMYLNVSGTDAAVAQQTAFQPTTPPSGVTPPPPDRLTQWRVALRIARNRPLLGVGPDNFRWVYGDFAGLNSWDVGGHANSLYFEWLADTGLIGLGLFLWLVWRMLRTSFGSLLTRPQPSNAAINSAWIWRLALAASLSAWFLHGLFDYFYEPLPTNLAFWLVAGLGLAAVESARRHGMDEAACASRST